MHNINYVLAERHQGKECLGYSTDLNEKCNHPPWCKLIARASQVGGAAQECKSCSQFWSNVALTQMIGAAW